MGHGMSLPHTHASRPAGTMPCALVCFCFDFSGFSFKFDPIKWDLISCISTICTLADSRGAVTTDGARVAINIALSHPRPSAGISRVLLPLGKRLIKRLNKETDF